MKSHLSQIRVLIAPSGFKEGLDAAEVAACMAEGVKTALPNAQVRQVPMADGGEGFTRALVELTGGTLHPVRVTGPVGDPVDAVFGMMGGRERKTAVIEMAAAAGLRLVPRDARDPRRTTSYGVGEMIRAALDAGAERILLGCGDSGINDGGAGMAQALGVGLLDEFENPIGRGGRELARLRRIDLGGRDPRLARVRIDAAVNWHNVLLGPRGVARVFGPQKGATPEMVEEMERGLVNYADIIRRDLGLEVGAIPGGGASGGLGAGLRALLGGHLNRRWDIIMKYIDLDGLLAKSDLVLTAEGGIDGQTPFGKVPSEVARRAKRLRLPVIAIAGTVGQGAEINLAHGIDAYTSILRRPCSLAEAIADSQALVRTATEQTLRMLGIGLAMAARRPTMRKAA
jgi:glycerate kinase